MNHEEAYSELAAVALDATSSDVADAVRAHAATCVECASELAAMEQTAVALGELAPVSKLNPGRSAGIRSRLVMRARSERESKSAPVPGPPDLSRGVASLTGLGHMATPTSQKAASIDSKRPTPVAARQPVRLDRAPSRFNWYAIAATLALIITGGELLKATREMDDMKARLAAVTTTPRGQLPKADSMATALTEKEAMIEAMAGPDVKVVALTSKSAQQPLGRMFWNRATNDWMMITYGLPAPKPGMTYQVWLVTDKAKISAGTFHPDAHGRTVMHANYALSRDALRAVAITEEPEGGMPAPTGPMVVVGSA